MLWGNKDFATGNNKPLYANTTNTTSNSVINGTSANLVYGVVAGVSATEQASSAGTKQNPTHSGWVSLKFGTGPITGVSLTNGGTVNANGFIIVTDGSDTKGSGANISYTINAVTNTVTSVTLNSGGSGYSNVSLLTYAVTGANLVQPTIAITLGGRAGRIQTETLVAMGPITLDDPKDNVFFSGI